jgi:hypothetical protein
MRYREGKAHLGAALFTSVVLSGDGLADYVTHYNEHRPHRALAQRASGTLGVLPDPIDEPDPVQLGRNDILGGLINEYRLAA